MSNLISTFYTENSRGRVEVHYESSGVLSHKFYSQQTIRGSQIPYPTYMWFVVEP